MLLPIGGSTIAFCGAWCDPNVKPRQRPATVTSCVSGRAPTPIDHNYAQRRNHADRGELSEPEVVSRIQARTGLTVEEIRRFLDTVWDSLIAVPDVVALLQETRDHGAALYCLSNMPITVFSHVRRRYTFWKQFEGIGVSGHVGMVKPDRAIYEHTLSRHALKAHETLFIDDLPQNIDAARQGGIDGFVFTGAAECRKTLVAKLRRAGEQSHRRC